jgi:hypothetical protein
MWRRVRLVKADVSEERQSPSSGRRNNSSEEVLDGRVVYGTVKMEAKRSSETSTFTRPTPLQIPQNVLFTRNIVTNSV